MKDNLHILVVDDQREFLTMIRFMLKQMDVVSHIKRRKMGNWRWKWGYFSYQTIPDF